MEISKRTLVIIAVVVVCGIGIVIVLINQLGNKEGGIPARTLTEAIMQKNVLSEKGAAARERLSAEFNGGSGILLSTREMGIGYSSLPDESVKVFIKGTDIEQIEQNAISWLMSRGFSREDLCYLPVIFVVMNPNAQADEEYKLFINHLPDYCSEVLGVE